MATGKSDPDAVDGYLAGLPDGERTTLEELRQLIKATVPEVQERISYGTTVAFALKRDLVGFVAQKKQMSFFTMSPEPARAMREEIEGTHSSSGATIHFSPDEPVVGQRLANRRSQEWQTQSPRRLESPAPLPA